MCLKRLTAVQGQKAIMEKVKSQLAVGTFLLYIECLSLKNLLFDIKTFDPLLDQAVIL